MKYFIASSNLWFERYRDELALPKNTFIPISKPSDLEAVALSNPPPDFIFFPHWSWRVPEKYFKNVKCILFHLAPLPFGRGGSPIQNLILRGFSSAPLCSLEMTKELDAGAIYLKSDIDLNGSLEQIFKRMTVAVSAQILEIIKGQIKPIEQSGEIVHFRRLTDRDGEIVPTDGIQNIFDKVRMLDGFGYPNAHMNLGSVELRFSEVRREKDKLTSTVNFVQRNDRKNTRENKESLTGIGLVRFVRVNNSSSHKKMLKRFFEQRPVAERISSDATLCSLEHNKFVDNNPYVEWWFVYVEGKIVGSFYTTVSNNLAISTLPGFSRLKPKLFDIVAELFPPLPAIKSIRRGTYSVNVSPKNKEMLEAMENHGSKLIEVSFEVLPKAGS